ncbi:MAG: DUF4097 family beta strand repeat protein [Clostridia bacterium]|nr:DUF4097 family beta strand repeat protein [Clostridia bacterium]
MSKNAKTWLIIAACLVLIGCIVFIGVMTLLNWDFRKLGTVKYETNTYEITNDFEKIALTTKTADVVFLPSEDGKCKIVCYEESKVKHDVKVESDTLVINVADSRKWYNYINFSFDTPKITVYLPMDKLTSLNVNNSTGDVDIPSGFSFENIGISASTGAVNCFASASGNIRIELSTGAINLTGLGAGSLDLKTSTGRIELKMIECNGDVSITTGTGKTKINALDCKNLYSTGSTGDIKLIGVIATDKFSIKRNTGDVEFERCDADEIYVKTSTGDIEGSLLSDKVFITKTSTGEIEVPHTTKGGKCELTTSTGDIEITIR